MRAIARGRFCHNHIIQTGILSSIFLKTLLRTTQDCTNQQLPQRGGAVPDPVWVGSKWLLAFPRFPVTPGTPLHFFAMLPPEKPRKGSIYKVGRLFSLFLFSCPTLALLRLVILLMSGKVHPNPGLGMGNS